MEQHYKLSRVRELADNDEDFIKSLIEVFLEEIPEDALRLKHAVAEKDYFNVYQVAHKMKPNIDLFELGVLDALIEVQNWGKFEKKDLDISTQMDIVLSAIDKTIKEMRLDFNL